MEHLRIHEKNIASAEIKRIKNLISKNKDTIDRLLNIDNNVEFNKKQIEKLKLNNKDNEQKLELLNKRYEDLSSNLLDDELKQTILTADIDMIKRQEKTDKKTNDKIIKKQNDKVYLDIDKKNTYNKYKYIDDMITEFALFERSENFLFEDIKNEQLIKYYFKYIYSRIGRWLSKKRIDFSIL